MFEPRIATHSALKSGNGKNQEIEFLRFLFAGLVVMCHSKVMLADADQFFTHGSLAVEFFFLLTGYLMMASVQNPNRSTLPTAAFVWHKIKAFYPELLVSVLLAGVVYLCSGVGIAEMITSGVKTLFSSLLLLRMTGIIPDYADWNGPAWYLSSMVIGLCIVYPLLRRYGAHALLLLSALCLCGYLAKTNGSITMVYHWNGICYSGNFRAVAELILGAFAWHGARWLGARPLPVVVRIALTLVKWLGILFVLFISQVVWMKWDGVCLLALWSVIVICFSNQSVDRVLFQNRLCLFLGAFSLPLYLSHRVWTFRLGSIIDLQGMNRWEILALLGVFSLASALVTMYGARLLRKLVLRGRFMANPV